MSAAGCHCFDLMSLPTILPGLKVDILQEDQIPLTKLMQSTMVQSDLTVIVSLKIQFLKLKISDRLIRVIKSPCVHVLFFQGSSNAQRCVTFAQLQPLGALYQLNLSTSSSANFCVAINNVHQSLLRHKLVYNGSFQTLSYRYSFAIQAMCPKFAWP